jgi:hypothetical protein
MVSDYSCLNSPLQLSTLSDVLKRFVDIVVTMRTVVVVRWFLIGTAYALLFREFIDSNIRRQPTTKIGFTINHRE